MTRDSHKRPAIEPASALFTDDPRPTLPGRPATVVSGAALILLRAVSSVPWMIALIGSRAALQSDYGLDHLETNIVIGIGLFFEGIWMLMLMLLCWLVWRGSNFSRMLVLCGASISIISSAVGYIASGEAITVKTTLLTLALDILILLALSSRDARSWSRSKRDAIRWARRDRAKAKAQRPARLHHGGAGESKEPGPDQELAASS